MAFLGPSLRRKRVTDRPGARVAAAALVSLALNAAFLLLIAELGAFQPMKMGKTEQVALESLTADQWNANRAISGAPPVAAAPRPSTPPQAAPATPPPPAAVKPPPEQKRPDGQIVDVAPSDDSRAPEKSRFLSDRDNRVAKETRSRWAGTQLYEKRAPAPVQGGKGPQREAGQGGKDREAKEAREGNGGNEGKPGRETPRTPAPSPQDQRLAMLEPGQAGVARPRESPPQSEEGLGSPGAPGAPGQHQDGKTKAGDPRLLPSVESMSRIAAGPSNDYIDRDVEEGDSTLLNTRGFKFATFWNRFKQDVSGHWRPAIVYQERDPTGTMYGDRSERATGLHVVLDSNGALKDVRVTESSGLEFLDREAVRAIRAAAPFYNVPSGLLDEKGEVSFSFGMVLVMNRAIPVRPQLGQ